MHVYDSIYVPSCFRSLEFAYHSRLVVNGFNDAFNSCRPNMGHSLYEPNLPPLPMSQTEARSHVRPYDL